MDQPKFEAALSEVIAKDSRYQRGAYYFLRDALDYTLKERKKTTGESGHVSGQVLLDGIRRFALKQFGPMVPTVFEYWGVKATEDFGHMVFSLVSVEIFGKTDRDSLDDFKDVYNFHDAFVAPFLPENSVMPKNRLAVDSPAQKLS